MISLFLSQLIIREMNRNNENHRLLSKDCVSKFVGSGGWGGGGGDKGSRTAIAGVARKNWGFHDQFRGVVYPKHLSYYFTTYIINFQVLGNLKRLV